MPLEFINPLTTSNTSTLAVSNNATVGGTLSVTGATTLSNNLTVNGGFVPSSSYNLRNKIINGNFDIWQRGTSLGSGTSFRFLSDRWINESDGSTYTVSQQPFTLGQTSVPHEPSFFHRTVVTSVAGTGNRAFFYQRIESVRTLAGKTGTLSFWAKADSSKNIAVEFNQGFGSGGSPSSGILGIGVTTCSLTTSWQKFTVTVSVPSIVGKTLGTNGNDFLSFAFWFDAGSNFNSRTNSLGQQSGTFDIAQVQLEEGNVATPFEVRPIGLELSLCQRYYVTYAIPQDYADGYSTNSFVLYRSYGLPATMRSIPTSFSILSQFTYYSLAGAANFTPTFSGVNDNRQSFVVFAINLTNARGFIGGTVGISAEL